jgi:hypothetical protein
MPCIIINDLGWNGRGNFVIEGHTMVCITEFDPPPTFVCGRVGLLAEFIPI